MKFATFVSTFASNFGSDFCVYFVPRGRDLELTWGRDRERSSPGSGKIGWGRRDELGEDPLGRGKIGAGLGEDPLGRPA